MDLPELIIVLFRFHIIWDIKNLEICYKFRSFKNKGIVMNDKVICAENQKRKYHTKCKDLIKQFISEHKSARFSVADLSQYLKAQGADINITTIYRNLDKLTSDGTLIKTKNPGNDFCFYQYAGEESECVGHLHLQCKVCGRIVHLSDKYMSDVYNYLRKEVGFKLDFRSSVLVGVCDHCRIIPGIPGKGKHEEN